MKRWAIFAGTPLFLLMMAVIVWTMTYPDPYDPKNMRYVLWKHGLASIDLDTATSALAVDSEGRQALIIGQSQDQLRKRFGFLLTPHQAGPALERCVYASWANDGTALYIRHSNLVVVFKNDIATEANILKPCE
jgi:hypothetical protein